jgi:hypothetical protein
MFPPTESERVKAIIEDRGIYDILVAEYPEPTHQPTTTTTPTTDDSDMEPF